jgi:zinc protease
VLRPAFPEAEVDRLRDERLTDLLQVKADPRRRADEAYIAAIYASSSPYHRPAGGIEKTVTRLDAAALRSTHAGHAAPGNAALVVAGDVDPGAVVRAAEALLGDWATDTSPRPAIDDRAGLASREVRVIHHPGSVQTEIRVGHPGLPRLHPDFHAVAVMSAILGGLFNSRLNMKLREEKGYTYGAAAGFDLRRARGPFTARAAVHTEATVPALQDLLAELDRIRETPVSDSELRAARDYLVGVFPLRFETPGPVAGSLAGLFVHGLPDDELGRYRAAIEAVGPDDVLRVARDHIRPDSAAIVLVGDHDAFGPALDPAGFAPASVERDEGPVQAGPADASDEPGPIDDEGGPTAGAGTADLPGTDEPADPGASGDGPLGGQGDGDG